MKDLGCRIQKELRLIKVGKKFFFYYRFYQCHRHIMAWHLKEN